MRVHHPAQYTQALQLQKAKAKENDKSTRACSSAQAQSSIPEFLNKAQKYERTSRRWCEITDSLTYCISKEMFPICTTEKDRFQRFIATLDPRYDIPSAKYMSGTAIPALYEKTREQVASDIMEPYLSYSIHFIDDNWILQTKCLQTLFVQKDHTADNLCEVMTETLTQWKLEMDRQVCITTDNGSNITCAVVNSTKDDSRVQRTVGLCRKLVSTFSHSWKKKRDLNKAQSDLGLPQHSLVTDCVTRWGSQLSMTGRILEQEACLRQVLATDCKNTHLIPTWQDLDVLESMQAALGPLKDFTDMLSGEMKVTVSAIKPVLHILKTKALKLCDGDTNLTKSIKGKIWDHLQNKYDDVDVNELLNVRTYLDPRFKSMYIEDGVSVTLVIDCLAREGFEIIEEQTSQSASGTGSTPPIATEVSECTSSTSNSSNLTKKRKLSSWLKEAAETQVPPGEPLTAEQKAKKELEEYERLPLLDSELDPLE